MPRDAPFACRVLAELGPFHPVQSRAMFGGYGLYLDGRFFAIIADGRLYFRTDERTRRRYQERGMHPFRPGDRYTMERYWEVPPDIQADAAALAEWAAEAAATHTPRHR